MHSGCCKFGLWRVAVDYDNLTVYRVRFLPSAQEGRVPVQFTQFLAGKCKDFHPLKSVAVENEYVYHEIYRVVSQIPYGETRTYGEIAELCGTHARVVGTAMARNPTPLLIPCHRVVSADGIGGFSPDLQIKKDLLALEQKYK